MLTHVNAFLFADPVFSGAKSKESDSNTQSTQGSQDPGQEAARILLDMPPPEFGSRKRKESKPKTILRNAPTHRSIRAIGGFTRLTESTAFFMAVFTRAHSPRWPKDTWIPEDGGDRW